ncbi:MAG: hypothetical protein AAGA56_10030, partial [Myxococcota bacterium]
MPSVLAWLGMRSLRYSTIVWFCAAMLCASVAGARPLRSLAPGPETQVQKSKAERGGVQPCNSPDPGFRGYRRWDRSPRIGQMLLPAKAFVGRDGRFDVVFHFHGHEPIRKEWVRVMDHTVLVGIDLGVGSAAYMAPFLHAHGFDRLLRSVEAGVRRRTGRDDARAGRIALSSWSAGYGALQQILRQPVARRIDAVFVLDGMHASYRGRRIDGTQLKPFIDYARRAERGDRLM